MSVLAEHQSTVTIDANPPIELPVSRQRVTMDREWVPYVQSTLTCPLGDGAIAALDPLADAYIWATIRVRRLLGRTDRLADLTLKYRDATLGSIAAADGPTLAALTTSLYHDYELPGSAIRSQQRDFRLIVRAAPIDWAAGEITFELGGGESRLLEDVNTGAPFTVPGVNASTGFPDKREKTNWVLARNGFAPVSNDGWGGTPSDEAAVWETGETAWEYLAKMLAPGSAGALSIELWCDETGRFRAGYDRPSLNNLPAAPKTTRTLWSYGADRSVKNAVEQRSRDEGYNAVVLIYRHPTTGAISYDVATTPGVPVRAYVEQRDGTPGGHAAVMLSRMRSRGRALEILAVSDYAWTPGDRGVFRNPRNTMTGKVAAVQWSHPDDEMSVRLREVEVS